MIMRRKSMFVFLTIIFCFLWTVGCAVEFDFTSLSAYELNQLGADVESAREKYFIKITSAEENAVLQVVKDATEEHFQRKVLIFRGHGLTIHIQESILF